MTLTKTLPHNVKVTDGNQLQTFVDQTSGLLYLKDANGNIAPFSDYVSGTQGLQGTQGTQGTQGIQGSRGFQGTTGVGGSQGVQGSSGVNGTTIPLYRGAFFSTQTQNSLGDEIKKVTYNNTDIGGQGVVLQNNSEILIQNAGDYNIAHSIQLIEHKAVERHSFTYG